MKRLPKRGATKYETCEPGEWGRATELPQRLAFGPAKHSASRLPRRHSARWARACMKGTTSRWVWWVAGAWVAPSQVSADLTRRRRVSAISQL